jgi:ABC-type sugar transport system permease subunit
MNIYSRRRVLIGSLFVLPAFLIVFIFLILPVFLSLFYSLTNWDGISSEYSFIGFRNFINVIKDPIFLQLLYNTLLLAVIYIPLLNLIAFVLAVLIYDMTWGKNLCKAILFFPNLLSMIVVGFVWRLIFAFNNGLINTIIRRVGLGGFVINWLGTPNVVLVAISVTIIWCATGFYMLIYLAGLSALPRSVFESAEIDGAGWFTKNVRITLPMIYESVKTNIILSTIGLLCLFDLPYVMTKGGPVHYSETMAVRIYYYAFKELQQGKGMALAIMLTVVTMSITLIILKTRQGEEV